MDRLGGPGVLRSPLSRPRRSTPEGAVPLPRGHLAAAVAGGFTVKLARSGRTLFVAPGDSILDTLRSGGVDVQASCKQGICGTCETRVLEGVPDHRDSLLSEDEQKANNVMMICCSGSKQDILVLDL